MVNQSDEQRHIMLGESLFVQGRYDEAKAAFKEVLVFNANDPNVYNWLGRIALIQQNYENAEEAFRKAIELNPDEPTYYSNLTLATNGRKRYSEPVQDKYFNKYSLILCSGVAFGCAALVVSVVSNYEWNEELFPLSRLQLYGILLCTIIGLFVAYSWQTNIRRLQKISSISAGLLIPIYLLALGIKAIHDEDTVIKYLHFGGYQATYLGCVYIVLAIISGTWIIRIISRSYTSNKT